MKILAALRWDKSKNTLDYMVIDSLTRQYYMYPTQNKIEKNNNEEHQINKIINSFRASIKEYGKIEIHAQVSKKNPKYKCAKVSEYVEEAVFSLKDITHDGKIHILKYDLKKGRGLNRVKEALKKLGLYKRGTSYIHRLWTVALHITKSTVPKAVKSLRQNHTTGQKIA